jgi:hypothetical protein
MAFTQSSCHKGTIMTLITEIELASISLILPQTWNSKKLLFTSLSLCPIPVHGVKLATECTLKTLRLERISGYGVEYKFRGVKCSTFLAQTTRDNSSACIFAVSRDRSRSLSGNKCTKFPINGVPDENKLSIREERFWFPISYSLRFRV